MKASVLIARFPYMRQEDPDVEDWYANTLVKLHKDERIGRVSSLKIDDTPITMTRNLVADTALREKFDYLVMVDSDMSPDLQLPGAKPFWDSTFDFMLSHHDRPCIVGSPYCGPPPHSNVYVFKWCNWVNDSPQPDMRMEMYSREEAAMFVGIQKVAALPTGLIMIDVRVFAKLPVPHFYYQWTNAKQLQKASTEDVTFTRDASMMGVPIYCNWDAWSGHWKRWRMDKPRPIYIEQIEEKYRKAVLDNISVREKIVDFGEGAEG